MRFVGAFGLPISHASGGTLPSYRRDADRRWELLQIIGRKRGMLISGGEVHTERAAVMVLDEFRGGKIGRITLESPGNAEG